MNGKITGMLSLTGMFLVTSFTFGEISLIQDMVFQELSPECYAWIQTLSSKERSLIRTLLEGAERSSQGKENLTSMIRALERYSTLLGRLADPDAQTLLDASFLPKFFRAFLWQLTPEQVPGLLRVLKEYQVSLNVDISSAQWNVDNIIRRLIEGIRDSVIENDEVMQILYVAEAYVSGQPLNEGNFYTKFFRKKPSIALVQELIDVAKKRLAQTGSVAPEDGYTAQGTNPDDLVQWVMDKTKDPNMTAADITSMIQDLEACIAFLESGSPMSDDNFWAGRKALPSLARLQELLHFLREYLTALEAAEVDPDGVTNDDRMRQNGNIWVRGRMIEIQGTGVTREMLQENIRNVGEYLAWRLDSDATDATLPNNAFVDELRGRRPDVEWLQKLIEIAQERLTLLDSYHSNNPAGQGGNIWIRGRIMELQGTGVTPETLQENIRDVGEYLAWRLDPNATAATLPNNAFVDELRGRRPDVEWLHKLIEVAQERLQNPTATVEVSDKVLSPKKIDDLVQWVMDKTEDPKMTAADISSMIQDLEACIAFLESGQPMSDDNFWAKRQELPSLARLQELLRFLQKHLAALEMTKHDSLPPVPEPDDTTVIDDSHEDSVRFGPPISVTMRKKRDKVLAQENIRCWKIVHEDYVNKVADELVDYITTHPNSPVGIRLKQWRSQVIAILNQANRLLRETQASLAAEENKLAQQQALIHDLKLNIEKYEHDVHVLGPLSAAQKNLTRAKNMLIQEEDKRIDRQNCIHLMRAQIREYKHYINVWDPEVKRRWREIQGKVEDVLDVTLETFAREHLMDVIAE